jgi:hypothetical protein
MGEGIETLQDTHPNADRRIDESRQIIAIRPVRIIVHSTGHGATLGGNKEIARASIRTRTAQFQIE